MKKKENKESRVEECTAQDELEKLLEQKQKERDALKHMMIVLKKIDTNPPDSSLIK